MFNLEPVSNSLTLDYYKKCFVLDFDNNLVKLDDKVIDIKVIKFSTLDLVHDKEKHECKKFYIHELAGAIAE